MDPQVRVVREVWPREAWLRIGRGRGGIGRHARFRFWWRKPWGFKSLRPHHKALAPGIRAGWVYVRIGWQMQVTETLSDGLKRAYTVVVAGADIESRKTERLTSLGK